MLGAMDKRVSEEGMKVSCTHFQCAAGAFTYLRDHFPHSYSVDMSHQILSLNINLMLGQAQECLLEKSMLDNRKSFLVARISAQVVDYYKEACRALENSETASLLGKIQKDWKKLVQMKIYYFAAVAHLHMGKQAEEQQKFGERVIYFQSALDKLNEAIKLAKGQPETVQEALRFAMDVIGGKYNSAKKDNDFIYHEAVPALDTLQSVKGAPLVKALPVNPTDPAVTGPDIFAKLVPMAAHEASSLYSEEKAKLLRDVMAKIEAKNEVLDQFMDSMQLDPETVDNLDMYNHIPPVLMEKCAALSVRPDTVRNLVQSMQVLSGVFTDVEASLKEIRDLLEEDEAQERKLQELLGRVPPAPASPPGLAEVSKECSKYLELHEKASFTNTELHRAMNLHLGNLRLLGGPLEQVRAALPTPTLSEDDKQVLQNLKRILAKVQEMRDQRVSLEQQLREMIQKDDITTSLVTADRSEMKKLFEEQLKKYDQLKVYLEQNLAAQENVLKALTDANVKYAAVRKALAEVEHKWNTTVQTLVASYEAYEDLMKKSQEGKDFYTDLEGKAAKLLERARAACQASEAHRQQLLERELKKQPPPRPTAPKPPLQKKALDEAGGPEAAELGSLALSELPEELRSLPPELLPGPLGQLPPPALAALAGGLRPAEPYMLPGGVASAPLPPLAPAPPFPGHYRLPGPFPAPGGVPGQLLQPSAPAPGPAAPQLFPAAPLIRAPAQPAFGGGPHVPPRPPCPSSSPPESPWRPRPSSRSSSSASALRGRSCPRRPRRRPRCRPSSTSSRGRTSCPPRASPRTRGPCPSPGPPPRAAPRPWAGSSRCPPPCPSAPPAPPGAQLPPGTMALGPPAPAPPSQAPSPGPLPGAVVVQGPLVPSPAPSPSPALPMQPPAPRPPPGSAEAPFPRQSPCPADLLSSSPESQPGGSAAPGGLLQPTKAGAQEGQRPRAVQLIEADPYAEPERVRRLLAELERFRGLAERLERPAPGGGSELDALWKELQEAQERDARQRSIAIARCYSMKNRHQDIMPYDRNRVVLRSGKDDYINASRVEDLSPYCPALVATQAPLLGTAADFWLMIYEQKVSVVVMLVSEQELDKKVLRYFPSERGQPVAHGPLTVVLTSLRVTPTHVERMLTLQYRDQSLKRTVAHLQFTSWPELGLPDSKGSLLRFIQEVHGHYLHQRPLHTPVVVHCSSGVGRTGAFCLLYAAVQEVEAGNGIPDLAQLVRRMRQQRKHMLQEKLHLKFCFEAVLLHAEQVLLRHGVGGPSLAKPPNSTSPKLYFQQDPQDLVLGGDVPISSIQATIAKLSIKAGGPSAEPGEGWGADPGPAPGPVEPEAPLAIPDGVVDGVGVPDPEPPAPRPPLPEAPGDTESSNHVGGESPEGPGGPPEPPAAPPASSSSSLELLASLTPEAFSLDASLKGKQRMNKQNFLQAQPGEGLRAPRPSDDPLSMLDPLWTLNKA
ncbi:LOW QUALITY PROTEIN: tyrosine-protein phosphatase non-receptor type 23 [Onychostruthus taczanowskii]|uniref:LOW QUALITY PROTEIN: tyrosine-protein phosphatase non-receptor type 23 n=1 Tax=Onychostruthus taczanowskii TaxID=356909 RepID=UPI001B80B10E|nr:LOW QUALITY PROTEIN: tyrosine-protein phosphatase non-receptor type 23 [Onychostruthus taczanowskii]